MISLSKIMIRIHIPPLLMHVNLCPEIQERSNVPLNKIIEVCVARRGKIMNPVVIGIVHRER